MSILKKSNVFVGLLLITSIGQSMAMLKQLAAYGAVVGGAIWYLRVKDNRANNYYVREQAARTQMEEDIRQLEVESRKEAEERYIAEQKRIAEVSERREKSLKANLEECKGDRSCMDFAYKVYYGNPSGRRRGSLWRP